jgi:ABC-type Fe3+-siderophore transport system permease subunit
MHAVWPQLAFLPAGASCKARRSTPAGPSPALVPSALAGAALLLAADLLVRLSVFVLPLSGPLPLGVLTALLGAPCLAAIARRVVP